MTGVLAFVVLPLVLSAVAPASARELLADRTLDPALVGGVAAVIKDVRPNALPLIDGPATLEGIRARGVIRVGYGRDIVPITYANARGDLVGFDISYAYQLARALHVRLELAPIDWTTLEGDLTAHRFDIVMAVISRSGNVN